MSFGKKLRGGSLRRDTFMFLNSFRAFAVARRVSWRGMFALWHLSGGSSIFSAPIINQFYIENWKLHHNKSSYSSLQFVNYSELFFFSGPHFSEWTVYLNVLFPWKLFPMTFGLENYSQDITVRGKLMPLFIEKSIFKSILKKIIRILLC